MWRTQTHLVNKAKATFSRCGSALHQSLHQSLIKCVAMLWQRSHVCLLLSALLNVIWRRAISGCFFHGMWSRRLIPSCNYRQWRSLLFMRGYWSAASIHRKSVWTDLQRLLEDSQSWKKNKTKPAHFQQGEGLLMSSMASQGVRKEEEEAEDRNEERWVNQETRREGREEKAHECRKQLEAPVSSVSLQVQTLQRL